MLRTTKVLAATPVARTFVSPTRPLPATRQHAELEPTSKPDAAACHAHTSLYRGIAQTHDGLGAPVNTQTSHTCYSCHHPFQPGTRPLACFAKSCMNLAHAIKRFSGPTVPPDQWRCLHHRNNTQIVPGVSASLFTIHEHPQNINRVTCGGCGRTIATNIRPFVYTAYHRTCSGLSLDISNIVTSTGHWACSWCLATTAPLESRDLLHGLQPAIYFGTGLQDSY